MKKEIVKKIKSKEFIRFLVVGIVTIALLIFVRSVINNVDAVKRIAQSADVFGPIVLILLISLGILLSPIPSVVLIIVAGYLYGTWWGALYSYLGHLLAALSAFTTFRRIKSNVESRRYKKYKKLVDKNRKLLYLFYTVPILPMTLITLISASSRINLKKFLEIISVSFIPAVLFFSFFGNKISSKNLLEIGIWTAVILIAGIIIYIIIQRNQNRVMNGYPSMIKINFINRFWRRTKYRLSGHI